jgi:hypothetical protein
VLKSILVRWHGGVGKCSEGIKDDALMYQEFPPTEDYAFVMTGTSFFSNSRCTDAFKLAKTIDYDCLPLYLWCQLPRYRSD